MAFATAHTGEGLRLHGLSAHGAHRNIAGPEPPAGGRASSLRLPLKSSEKPVSQPTLAMSTAQVRKGDIMAAQGDFTGAVAKYDLARKALEQNKYFFERFFSKNPMIFLFLLMTGRFEDAQELASQNYELALRQFAEKQKHGCHAGI